MTSPFPILHCLPPVNAGIADESSQGDKLFLGWLLRLCRVKGHGSGLAVASHIIAVPMGAGEAERKSGRDSLDSLVWFSL